MKLCASSKKIVKNLSSKKSFYKNEFREMIKIAVRNRG